MADKTTLLLLLIALTGVAFAAMRLWMPSTLEALLHFVASRRLWLPLCGVLLAAYLLALIYNTAYPNYLEHVEPQVASVSFVLLKGGPLYHSLPSTQRYSFPYGPMAYLPYTLALWTIGAKIVSLKFAVLLLNLGLVLLLWKTYRTLLRPAQALMLIAIILCYLLRYDYIFQVRGDILVIFLVALGLNAVIAEISTWPAVILLAAACGLAFDVKITAPCYFFPLYGLLLQRAGRWPAALAVLGAGVFAAAPFFFPGISLAHYLEWLSVGSREPFTSSEAMRELKLLPFVFAPPALLLWQMAKRSRDVLINYLKQNVGFLALLVAGLAVVAVTSLKIGAGPHHFMPFYPVLGYVCADVFSRTSASAAPRITAHGPSFVPLLWLWIAMAVLMQFGTAFPPLLVRLLTSRSDAGAVASDLEEVMKTYSGKKIEMGYGSWNANLPLTYFRPTLVFAGNPLTVDAVALGDMQLAGLTIPDGTVEYIRECKTQIWLIPKGEPPFSMINVYSLMEPRLFSKRTVFSDDFRQAFFERYAKQPSSKYYDVWECKA
jgi:hypothetical protein